MGIDFEYSLRGLKNEVLKSIETVFQVIYDIIPPLKVRGG